MTESKFRSFQDFFSTIKQKKPSMHLAKQAPRVILVRKHDTWSITWQINDVCQSST